MKRRDGERWREVLILQRGRKKRCKSLKPKGKEKVHPNSISQQPLVKSTVKKRILLLPQVAKGRKQLAGVSQPCPLPKL